MLIGSDGLLSLFVLRPSPRQALYLAGMCGRSTYKLTWEEIHALHRLTLGRPPRNTRARYNVCTTTTIGVVIGARPGERELVPMRWGLVPAWWSKSLTELKLATVNARAETVAEKPMFRSAFKRSRCLIPMSGYYEWLDTPGGKQPCWKMLPLLNLYPSPRIMQGERLGAGVVTDHFETMA